MRTKITKHGEILNIFIIKLYLENSIGKTERCFDINKLKYSNILYTTSN